MKLNYAKDPDAFQTAVTQSFSNIPFSAGQPYEVQFYSADLPLRLSYQLPSPPKHLLITYLRNETDDTPPTAAFLDWYPDGGAIIIRGVTGLTAAKLYTMRLLAFA